MKIVCVAVVGKNNSPLYIKSFDSAGNQDPLSHHYVVHTSLDVVEERVAPSTKKGTNEMYLGLLCPTEDYKVYGYITNTKIKLIAVIDDYEVKETEMKAFFRSFHTLLADAVCNPFYSQDQPITNRKFDRDINALVKSKSPDS